MTQEFKNTATAPSEILSLLWNPRAQFWFLYSLAIAFTIAAITKIISRRNENHVFGIVAVAYYAMPNTGNNLIDLTGAHLIYFYMGSELANSRVLQNKPKTYQTFILTAATAAAQFANQEYKTTDVFLQKSIALGLATLSIACTISIAKHWSERRPTQIAAIGKNSMPIYLMHIIFASGARTIAHKILNITDPTWHILIGTISGMAGPLLVNEALKKKGITILYHAPVARLLRTISAELRRKR